MSLTLSVARVDTNKSAAGIAAIVTAEVELLAVAELAAPGTDRVPVLRADVGHVVVGRVGEAQAALAFIICRDWSAKRDIDN